MISNCERAGCAGFVRFYNRDVSNIVLPQFWWSCLNCSILSPQRNLIDFPVMQVPIGTLVNPLITVTTFSIGRTGSNCLSCAEICPQVQCPYTASDVLPGCFVFLFCFVFFFFFSDGYVSFTVISDACKQCAQQFLLNSAYCRLPRCRGDPDCVQCTTSLALGVVGPTCLTNSVTCAFLQCGVSQVVCPSDNSTNSTPLASNTTLYPEVNVTITSQRSHYQLVAESYGIVFQVLFSIWTMFNCVSSFVFLIGHIQKRKKDVPVLSVAVLSLECFCNLFRFT